MVPIDQSSKATPGEGGQETIISEKTGKLGKNKLLAQKNIYPKFNENMTLIFFYYQRQGNLHTLYQKQGKNFSFSNEVGNAISRPIRS